MVHPSTPIHPYTRHDYFWNTTPAVRHYNILSATSILTMNVIDESSSAFDPSERGERPLSAVPGVVQQKSPRFALSFAVALDVGPSPPTPSLTRDIPFSSPMTKSNHDAKGSKSRSKKESNNDRNYITDGDTALSKTPLKTKSDAAADDDAATSVERIVNAAESREASSRESSLANGTKKSNENFNGCGPFTASELSQLSLLRPERWSVLDQDLVVSLTSMLQVHVAAGVGIDLVSEGRSVVLRGMEVGRGPVISVQQVRFNFPCDYFVPVIRLFIPCVLLSNKLCSG